MTTPGISLVDVAKDYNEESFIDEDDKLPTVEEKVLIAKPVSSLMDIAKDESSKLSLMDIAKEGKSLMDVAKEAPISLAEAVNKMESASLVDVAKAVHLEHQSTIATVLNKVAEENQKDSQISITQALKEASKEIIQERSAETLGLTLQQAAQEIRQEKAFQYDSSNDKVATAANILARQQIQSPKMKKVTKTSTSVDHEVFKSRKGQGLKYSGPVLKSRKDQLTSFQHNHLTETQKRLLYATLVEHKPPKKQNNQSRSSYLDRIATPVKPKKRTGKEQYAREDDRKHCKFKPKVGRGSRESGDRSDNDDEGDNQDFIRRMEASEKAKNDTIRRSREEREYMAQLDKKECPKCGNTQSYSEVKQKRKQCPNCGITYRSRMAWDHVEIDFFKRVEQFEDHKVKRRDEIAKETTPSFRLLQRKVFDPHTNTITTINLKPLTWKDVEEDFLNRVQLDEMNRIINREELEQEFYGYLTFHPSITPHARRMEYVRFEERMQRDIEERALRREQVVFSTFIF
ncbi:cleavage induced predicted protein [Thraustotheca clavata]|uniref:Uncharacterized protein n=1 Tax=Thraustotheca clavata TaxID=74557 RepID=A0A1V9Y8X5_9STRA|nr:cleavage induced predicted protein [Thraustotheca clavata]